MLALLGRYYNPNLNLARCVCNLKIINTFTYSVYTYNYVPGYMIRDLHYDFKNSYKAIR